MAIATATKRTYMKIGPELPAGSAVMGDGSDAPLLPHQRMGKNANGAADENTRLQMQYDMLDSRITTGMKALGLGLRTIAPALADMQELLSQRGGNHPKIATGIRLPGWDDYCLNLAKETGVGFRTIKTIVSEERQKKQGKSEGKKPTTVPGPAWTKPVKRAFTALYNAVDTFLLSRTGDNLKALRSAFRELVAKDVKAMAAAVAKKPRPKGKKAAR